MTVPVLLYIEFSTISPIYCSLSEGDDNVPRVNPSWLSVFPNICSAMAIYTAPHIVQLLSCRCGNSPFIMSCLGLNHLTDCSQAIVEGPM